MFSPIRPLFIVNAFLCLLAASLVSPAVTLAQAEPTAIINAAFADLSTKLGVSVTRQGNTTYTYEQIAFPDNSLGCPKPGVAYSQIVTKGYKILITYPRDTSNVYDYRASNDGTTLFQCSAPAVTGGAAPTAVAPTAVPVNPVNTAPVTLTNPFAFVDSSGNVTLAHIGDSKSVLLTGDSAAPAHIDPFTFNSKTYSHLIWSPDGSKLLFVEFKSTTLYLASSGVSPVVINAGLKSYYPGAWSPDGTKVAYAVPTGQSDGGMGQVNQVQAVTVTSNGTGNSIGAPQYAGTFVQGVGCGGGGLDPAEARYYEETGYAGNDLVLAWTTKGFIYSMTCVGTGLALADTSGKVLWHLDNVSRAAISPDRTRAVAAKTDKTGHPVSLEIIDLSTGAETPLASETGPDQSAWSADGTAIIYSTLAPAKTVTGSTTAPARTIFSPEMWPVEAHSWTTTVFRMPATGGASTKLFQREGRAIGTISVAPDNSGVLFSFVTSFAELIARINAGAAQAQIDAAEPHAELFYVPLAGNAQAVNLTRGGQPTFGKGTFTVVPATAVAAFAPAQNGQEPVVPPSSNVAPPNLVIGGHAIVTTTRGDTLNLRKTPGRTAPILGILKPGTVVLIEAGPQNGDGLRWWQVRTVDDNREGWVIDQITDQDGTTNTLAPQ